MRTLALGVATALAAVPAFAQNQTLIFTGRFDFTGLDAANERPGGSINEISEFALTGFTPGVWTSARTVVPATTHQVFWGDPYGDGNYSRLDGFKTTFEQFNFAGPFVKDADRSSGDVTQIYWTVRDAVGKNFTVFTGNGAATDTIAPGDFFRWLPNGDVEFFVRASQFAIAQGAQQGSGANGASALCQDTQGNIYYSPAQGGHWVNGNLMGGDFAYDGAICMIPASAITYDAAGNVQSILPDSAKLVINEIGSGTTGGPNVRDLMAREPANDTSGNVISSTANMVGLELDPLGGTFTSSIATGTPPNQTFEVVPNLIFTFDNGTYAGSIFTTRDTTGTGPGGVARINGVVCGETTATVPASGAWTGTQQSGFSPTTMGICLIDEIPQPLIADLPAKGALTTTSTNWEIDFNGSPATPVFVITQPGPATPSLFAPAIPTSALPIPSASLNGDSFPFVVTWPTPNTQTIVALDFTGYGSYSVPSPWSASLVGGTLMIQGASPSPAGFLISNPTLVHVK